MGQCNGAISSRFMATNAALRGETRANLTMLLHLASTNQTFNMM